MDMLQQRLGSTVNKVNHRRTDVDLGVTISFLWARSLVRVGWRSSEGHIPRKVQACVFVLSRALSGDWCLIQPE